MQKQMQNAAGEAICPERPRCCTIGAGFLISVAVICNLAAKAIWGRPPVIVPLVGLVVLLISAIGLYICRHETFGVCTQEESQSLWHAGRIWRRVRAALLGTMIVCFLIYLWRW